MSRLNHVHYVAPLPGEPDLFEQLSEIAHEQCRALYGDSGFEPPAQRVDTSLAAAAKITKHTARIREAIWLWLKTQGSHGATASEICNALGLSGSTVRPRLIELSGKAKWAPGLPARIQRSPEVRQRMHVYVAL